MASMLTAEDKAKITASVATVRAQLKQLQLQRKAAKSVAQAQQISAKISQLLLDLAKQKTAARTQVVVAALRRTVKSIRASVQASQ